MASLGFNLDIIVGLSGRYQSSWDNKMRPEPPYSRILSLKEAQSSSKNYHCIIAHNLTDLLDVKFRKETKILILHSTFEGLAVNENSTVKPSEMKALLERYIKAINLHVVAISELKGRSWGQAQDIVYNSVNPAEYLEFKGDIAKGLRISNFIDRRSDILMWEFHQQAFNDIPVKIVGHNPNMEGVTASNDWDDLKRILQAHRFYIHTADPSLEDGYNMATLEAMAAGMPVLGNISPTSPIVHGVSGYLSDDPAELKVYARRLIDDKELAIKMGKEAKKIIEQQFSPENFKTGFINSIAVARKK